MPSILEEFAYGNICPQTQSCGKDSEQGQALALVGRIEAKLLARLSPADAVLLEKLTDAQAELNRLTAVQNFLYGYKLGLIMTAEAFTTRDDLTQ